MKEIQKVKKKTVNFLFDHPLLKNTMKNSYMVLITIISALIFSFGFKCFIAPNYEVFNPEITSSTVVQLASCGASGLSQSFVTLLKLFGIEWIRSGENQYIMNFVFYFVINIPLCVLGWLKIGKKFTLYTILNVVLVTVFGIILPTGSKSDFINEIALSIFDQPVARVLFGALCTAISSALAYSIDTSAGGTDIIAYYISERKSRPIGKFSAILNFIVVMIFTVLSVIPGGIVGKIGSGDSIVAVSISTAFIILLYTFLYMIVVTLIVDTVNIQNKKENVQIITKNVNLSNVILANIPHGCTILEAKGGYTGEKLYIIYMTVRKNEAKKVVNVCKKADPNCFINEIPMDQVYGKFFRKPIE